MPKEMLPLLMDGKIIPLLRFKPRWYREGSELEGLQLWVDNGDAQTQAGELMELEDYGIFSIEIPQNGSWVSSAQSFGYKLYTVQLGFMAVLTRSPTNLI